jgi:serine/arginine repetitive matrix protein 2
MKSFGKSKNKAPAAEAPKSRFKSRFADSSDEEEGGPRRFESRFADSDDSDEFELPPDLTPVRGIPRRAGDEDGDSTDLEEETSDAETPVQPQRAAPSVTNGVGNGQGTKLSAGSLHDNKSTPGMPVMEAGKKAKSKRGFFGLGKKKPPPSYLDSTNSQNGATSDIPMPPEHRNRDLNRPLSAIGEDNEIGARGGADRGDIPQQQPSSPRSPKLQRRSTPQWGRSTSDSWPLPTPPAIGAEARPQSSDGVMNQRRPTLVKRFSSQSRAQSMVGPSPGKQYSGSVVGGGDGSVAGRSGKKKKFQGLRRVFGLHD